MDNYANPYSGLRAQLQMDDPSSPGNILAMLARKWAEWRLGRLNEMGESPDESIPFGGSIRNDRLVRSLRKYVKDSMDRIPPRKAIKQINERGGIPQEDPNLFGRIRGLSDTLEPRQVHPSAGSLYGSGGDYPFAQPAPETPAVNDMIRQVYEALNHINSPVQRHGLADLIDEFATSFRPSGGPGFTGWPN